MPVAFGQEEAITQKRARVNATVAMPDRSLVSDMFEQREMPKVGLDLRPVQAPIPFHPEMDAAWPEGMGGAINAVLEGQDPEGAICKLRGVQGDATYPKVSFETVMEEEILAPIKGFKKPNAPNLAGINTAVPADVPVAKLREQHIVSVMSEELHGYRKPDPENAAIMSHPHPAGGSRLYGRNRGMAREQNPRHFKKPRFGISAATPPLQGTDYGGYRINNGLLPDQRRLPDNR